MIIAPYHLTGYNTPLAGSLSLAGMRGCNQQGVRAPISPRGLVLLQIATITIYDQPRAEPCYDWENPTISFHRNQLPDSSLNPA